MRLLAHAVAVACLALAAGGAGAATTQSSTPSVQQMLDRYPAQAPDLSFLKSEDDFKRFRQRYTADAGKWLAEGDAALRRRRELVAAAVALEIAHAGFDTAWDEVRDLAKWGSDVLRKSPRPDEAERLWHLAALPLIQGAFDYRLMIQQKDDVWLKRLPREPRLLFAIVVMLDGETWPEPHRGMPWADDESLERAYKLTLAQRGTRQGATSDVRARSAEYQRREKMRQVMTILEDLSNSIEVRADALLRLGVLHLRLRNTAVARDQFEDTLKLTSEPFLVYLAHFFNGVALEQEGDRTSAVAAYRAAVGVMPRAQAASFALASLLFVQDRREEAATLIESAIQWPAAPDPWRTYQSGDHRLWPERIAALRKALR